MQQLTEFIAINLEFPEIYRIDPCNCKLCGRSINSGVYYRDVISDNFNDFFLFRYETDYLCSYCAACFKGKMHGRETGTIRNFNVFIDKSGLEIFEKGNAINCIMHAVSDYVILVTYSNKKHCFFNGGVNNPESKLVTIGTDKYKLVADKEMLFKLSDTVQELLDFKFSKSDIEAGFSSKLNYIERYGIDKFDEQMKYIKQHDNTQLLEFVLHVVTAKKEKIL